MDTFIWLGILLITAGITVLCLGLMRHFESALLQRRIFCGVMTALFVLPAVFLSVKYPLNAGIVLLHLTGFMLGAMIVDGIMDHGKKKKNTGKRWIRITVSAMTGCFLYLLAGYVNADLVRRTEYAFETTKAIPDGSLRIAQISDAHLGTALNSRELKSVLERIGRENVDFLVVTGDLVDENTSRKEMQKACEAFAAAKYIPKIIYVAGNHEAAEDGDVTEAELFEALEESGVLVLRDQVATVRGCQIVGRMDASESRQNISQLMKEVDPSNYIVVLDHQPNDFDREAAAGVDLVLCGHMHGGYVLPLGLVGPLFSGMFQDADRIAGTETRGSTNFVVSTGAGQWGCSFKTGTRSEYVIIDICGR